MFFEIVLGNSRNLFGKVEIAKSYCSENNGISFYFIFIIYISSIDELI